MQNFKTKCIALEFSLDVEGSGFETFDEKLVGSDIQNNPGLATVCGAEQAPVARVAGGVVVSGSEGILNQNASGRSVCLGSGQGRKKGKEYEANAEFQLSELEHKRGWQHLSLGGDPFPAN